MQSLNESLIKDIKNIKKENISNGKLEKNELKEEFKRKDEETKKLCNQGNE